MADGDMNDGMTSDLDEGEVEIDESSPKNGDMGFDSSLMAKRLKELEHRKVELDRENADMREKISDLMKQLDTMRNEETKMRERLGEMEMKIHQSDSDKRSLDAIAARAQALETENSRLREDLSLTTIVDGEVERLKDLLEDKVKSVENLERENDGLLVQIGRMKAEVESAKEKISNVDSERINAEVTSKASVVEKDNEMARLRNRVGELESVIANNKEDSEKLVRDRAAFDIANVGELDPRILNEEMEAMGLFHGFKKQATQWPALLVSAGAVTAIAVAVYLRYAKLRGER